MKIVQINSVPNGSTGKIMMSIHKELLKQGYDSYVVWGRGRKAENDTEICMNDKLGVYFHVLYSRLTGKTGFGSKNATKKLIKKLEQIKPDIVHLHNIHGYYINIELLFNYLKNNNIKVIWTFHDCWAFTGQCPHFLIKKCDKWQSKCFNCPMIKEYPKSFVDNSRWNFNKKKDLFTCLDNIIIVTPSKWLSGLIGKSFMKKYDVRVINNGIDINIFKPTDCAFRKKNNLGDKKIILGVANVWDVRKGLNDFIELSGLIDDDYIIVLVGLTDSQIEKLPHNIIGISRTENQSELAGIYSTADVFFNPTYEDTYPTVNLESISCGTPVVTYETGGSTEIAIRYGKVVEKGNIRETLTQIEKIINNQTFKNFDRSSLSDKLMINKYCKLYKER